jgi:transposase
MSTRDRVTDEQWELIERLLPSPSERSDGRGRPWKNNREVLNGIIWILRSGARWKDLPRDFPSYQTCHRRFQQWVTDGTLRKILEVLARDLEERGEIDLQECFIDGSFSGAKKGGLESAKPSVARGRSSWQWRTLMVFQSPSTQEVLRHMKSPLSRKLSNKTFSLMLQNDSLVTELMTVTHLMNGSKKEE